ncbi:MAG TPA: hypothetical protein VIJ95_11395 [Hanamia sp.]
MIFTKNNKGTITKTAFKNAAEEVFNLMNKGEGNQTEKEKKRVQLLNPTSLSLTYSYGIRFRKAKQY